MKKLNYFEKQIITNAVQIVSCIIVIVTILAWVFWEKETHQEIVSLKEFSGRIFTESQISDMRQTPGYGQEGLSSKAIQIPFEEALKSGPEAILIYGYAKIEILRPDSITPGLTQRATKIRSDLSVKNIEVYNDSIIISTGTNILWYAAAAILMIIFIIIGSLSLHELHLNVECLKNNKS